MLLLLLSLSLASAEDAAAVDPGSPATESLAPPAEPVVATVAERLELARDRARRGDLDGAELLVAQVEPLLSVDHEHAEAAYLRAWILEHRGQTREALIAYDTLVRGHPVSPLVPDARFRAAECAAALGDFAQARERLAALPAQQGADAVKVDLLLRVWALEERPGGKRRVALEHALAGAPADQAPVTQARARLAVLDDLLAEAASYDLQTRERRFKRHLDRRARLLREAEAQLVDIVRSEQIAHALVGLAHLGAAYERLGDDLLAAPAPQLTDDQRAIYEAELRKKAEILWVRAQNYYERGVDLALRTQWAGPELAELEDAQAAVIGKIETGG